MSKPLICLAVLKDGEIVDTYEDVIESDVDSTQFGPAILRWMRITLARSLGTACDPAQPGRATPPERTARCESQDESALRKELRVLRAENQALRNLANNLQPGPISQALTGERYENEVRLMNALKRADAFLARLPEGTKVVIGSGSQSVEGLRGHITVALGYEPCPYGQADCPSAAECMCLMPRPAEDQRRDTSVS